MVFKPLFNRVTMTEWVALRPIIRSNLFIAPGNKVDGLKRFVIRSLYRRGSIGPAGHPWTEMRLDKIGVKRKVEKDG